jgi:hypothetical protein
MKKKRQSIAEASRRLTGLFEAELLVRLMLWRWQHPFADDKEFANDLLEAAADVLRKCVDGNERFLENVHPLDMNLVAAVWYAEWAALSAAPASDADGRRGAWLDAVRHALPSCFCNPEDL